MSPEMWTALSGIVVSLVTAAGSGWVARAGRRTRAQERRDDFNAVTEQQAKSIERLERRIAIQETEAEKQRERIGDQDEAISWLLTRVRDLVGHIRKSGTQPPPAEPMPERVRSYIRYLDV